jgi:hypothetical protein
MTSRPSFGRTSYPAFFSKERSRNLTTHEDKYRKKQCMDGHKIILFETRFVTCIVCEDHVQPDVETKLLAHKVLDHLKTSLRDWKFKDGGQEKDI